MNGEVLRQAWAALVASSGELRLIHQGGVDNRTDQPIYPGTNCREDWHKCNCRIAKVIQETKQAADALKVELSSAGLLLERL